ncbi:MAG: hypothetical protein HQL92_02430 [Magnetococcales bacterium]|nr:hypothetical protein [Magnetococcales bacterium]
MRLPIKINNILLPSIAKKYFSLGIDPYKLIKNDLSSEEFTRSISAIKIRGTWKTSSANRHLLSDKVIIDLCAKKEHQKVLDIGISDGSASINLMKKIIEFNCEYVGCDLVIQVAVVINKNKYYFYDIEKRQCIMIVSDRLIIYNDTKDAIILLKNVVNYFFRNPPIYDEKNLHIVALVSPDVQRLMINNKNITVVEHDVFTPWGQENVDVVKIANVLNRVYFSDQDIILAINHIRNALVEGGHLIVIDSRECEKFSVFEKCGKDLKVRENINGGTEIRDLVS